MKKVEIGIKQIIIFCILIVISWGGVFYIRDTANDNLLLFLEVMYAFPFIICFVYMFILSSRNFVLELKNNNKKAIKESFPLLLCILLVLFVFMWLYVPICKDLVEGPKEIILCNVKLTKYTGGYHDYVDNYYISGISKDKEKFKIEFKHYRQSVKELENLINNSFCLKVIYYENTNISYHVEKGEFEYDIYKPDIYIIDVPNADID